MRPNSTAADRYALRAGADSPAVTDASTDMIYFGGRTIPDLVFKTFYVGGAAWDRDDIDRIDTALAATMSDTGLNDIVRQYFDGPITSRSDGSQLLQGDAPGSLGQSAIETMLAQLFDSSSGLDPAVTIFNFALPPGTVLTDERVAIPRSSMRRRVVPKNEAVDSLNGLAGLHGSTVANGTTLYYTVAVYSEQTNNHVNGIVAFDESWMNVAASFYHELNEARTDPDVALVIAGGPDSLLGWMSQQGNECGDWPVETADPLSQVFQEVPVAAGGTAPVQFLYSNRVHGAEGPVAPVWSDSTTPAPSSTTRPPRVGAALRAAIEATLGAVGPGHHDQTHSSESYGVTVHYKSP